MYKPTGKPNGRPPKKVDLAKVMELAGNFQTHEEIAVRLEVSPDTLTRTRGYAEAYKKGRLKAHGSLRARQFSLAMGGSIPMCIWLGKQYLGQKDIVTNEMTGELTLHDADARDKILSKLASLAAAERDRESNSLPN